MIDDIFALCVMEIELLLERNYQYCNRNLAFLFFLLKFLFGFLNKIDVVYFLFLSFFFTNQVVFVFPSIEYVLKL